MSALTLQLKQPPQFLPPQFRGGFFVESKGFGSEKERIVLAHPDFDRFALMVRIQAWIEPFFIHAAACVIVSAISAGKPAELSRTVFFHGDVHMFEAVCGHVIGGNRVCCKDRFRSCPNVLTFEAARVYQSTDNRWGGRGFVI